MHRILTLICCLLLTGALQATRTAATGSPDTELFRKKKQEKQPAKPAPKPSYRQTGLFTVEKTGEDWFFEIADSLLERHILTTIRFTGTPASTSKYGGEMVGYQTVYWQTAPDNRLLLRAHLLINTSDSVDAINRAVTISNVDPIIGSFKVESHKDGARRVKVTAFFNEDNAALGLDQDWKKHFGLGGPVGGGSFIESIKTFPMNTEVRTVKTWTSAGPNTMAGSWTGKVTFGLNISFVLLPKVPMPRRLFDPRVGYFTDSFNYFSDRQQKVERRRFITRWRLEPKDSADAEKMKRGELVEPKKPIVYYIDPATPKKWRPYLIQGVNDWQKAFEHAGFKNAICAKEWPDSDSTMSMEDARYSVIRYLASPIPNAYGPQVHDPRTGEIIESHIGWYHNVMSLVHDWYMIQAGTIDEAARAMRFPDELMGELIRFVSSHEVGHTLGLRHNFGSSSLVPVDSLRSKAWVEKFGHTPSIMDYARFNYVAQPEDSITRTGIFPRIGDYDIWAIQWGYSPTWNSYDEESDHYELEPLVREKLASNPRLWFGDGETNRTRDSRCQTEDLGDDAVKASTYGIMNLKREIRALPEWTYESNDIYTRNISTVYEEICGQLYRYVYHVLTNIGGVYADFKTVDEDGAVYTNVGLERQRECLQFLRTNVFEEPRWLIEEPYMLRITPDPEKVTASLGESVVKSLVSLAAAGRLNAEYPASLLLPDLRAMLFEELRSGTDVSRYRKALQAIYVRQICTAFPTLAINSEARPAFLAELESMKKELSAHAHSGKDAAHFAALADAVQRALRIE